MSDQSYDSRAIANLMLDEAHRNGQSLTNLALQKLLYFAHALYLVEKKKPLVSGYFEAWEYGPVHPAAYRAFKSYRDLPISEPASGEDVLSGARKPIPTPVDPDVRRHVRRVMSQYGWLDVGRLVDISHAKGAPWHFVLDKSGTGRSYGVRIPDEVILSRFKHHKIAVGETPAIGAPGEDTPPA